MSIIMSVTQIKDLKIIIINLLDRLYSFSNLHSSFKQKFVLMKLDFSVTAAAQHRCYRAHLGATSSFGMNEYDCVPPGLSALFLLLHTPWYRLLSEKIKLTATQLLFTLILQTEHLLVAFQTDLGTMNGCLFKINNRWIYISKEVESVP